VSNFPKPAIGEQVANAITHKTFHPFLKDNIYLSITGINASASPAQDHTLWELREKVLVRTIAVAKASPPKAVARTDFKKPGAQEWQLSISPSFQNTFLTYSEYGASTVQ
jgi:hypothetical protein